MTFGVIQYWFGKRYPSAIEAPRTDSSRAGRPHHGKSAELPLTRRLEPHPHLHPLRLRHHFWAAFEQAGSSLNLLPTG
jgi:hypothetical protein